MPDPSTDRRSVLRAAAITTALTGLAGCNALGSSSTPTDDADVVTDAPPSSPERTATDDRGTRVAVETDAEPTPVEPEPDPLRTGGSSTVYPVMNRAASYWNANRPATDREYWPHEKYGIETDERLADYWAGKYGFAPGEDSDPPFPVSVGLSHSETGLRSLRQGHLDLGNASTTVARELPDLSRTVRDRFVDHVIGSDAVSVVVSDEIVTAGVTELTGKELAAIYEGAITNWREVGGPDRGIEVYARPEGSGTRTAFVAAILGDPVAETSVDNRYGQSQRLALAIAESNAAIGYLGLGFLETEGVEPVALSWRGTTYAPDDGGYAATGYPLKRDLHAYSWEGTSKKEAALLRMLLSEFGQQTFVAKSGFATLPADRRRAELAKLPAPVTD